jgi:hypothetical protein
MSAGAHFFSYEMADPKKGDKKDKDKGKGDKPAKKGPETVRTQMVGETPDDDLGYDPKKIPVEDIPD